MAKVIHYSLSIIIAAKNSFTAPFCTELTVNEDDVGQTSSGQSHSLAHDNAPFCTAFTVNKDDNYGQSHSLIVAAKNLLDFARCLL